MAKDFFLNRYKQLGAKIQTEIKLKPSIRANTLKINADALRVRLRERGVVLKKIPYTKNGFFIEQARFKPSAAIEHLQGLYYIQESASQLPVEVLEPMPNELVLDMTASPGGKTTQISAEMKNSGCVVAVDIKKIDALCNNIERIGAENCIVYEMNALDVKELNIEFDKILLDAPCSGNFATDKEWFEKRDIEGINRSAELQKQLLKAAVSVLKHKGTIVYSTCSLEPEENEMVADWAIKNLPLQLEPASTIGSNGLADVFGKKLSSEIKKTKRLWPDKTATQGFFIAKFTKK